MTREELSTMPPDDFEQLRDGDLDRDGGGRRQRALVDEITRLRALIADTQDRNGYHVSHGHDWCVWCGHTASIDDDHDAGCPAFTPDGAVR